MPEGLSMSGAVSLTPPATIPWRWSTAMRTQAAYCLLFLVPVRWQVGPTTVGLLDVFALAMGLWLIWGPVRAFPKLIRTPVLIPMAAYGSIVFLSFTVAQSTPDFIKEVVKVSQGLMLYLGFALLLYDDDDPKRFTRSFWLWT